jgi:hypothetical protein
MMMITKTVIKKMQDDDDNDNDTGVGWWCRGRPVTYRWQSLVYSKAGQRLKRKKKRSERSRSKSLKPGPEIPVSPKQYIEECQM